jgi:hypothetical protein
MSKTEQIAVVALPGNTLMHSEVHLAVMDFARAHNTTPETITFFQRGVVTKAYTNVIHENDGRQVHGLIKPHKPAAVASYRIFQYDEFYIGFANGMNVKFMTPELIKEQEGTQ